MTYRLTLMTFGGMLLQMFSNLFTLLGVLGCQQHLNIYSLASLCPHSNGQSNSLWAPPCVGSPIGSASS